MLNRKKTPSALDHAIARVHEDMETFGPNTPEYEALLSELERLCNLKDLESKRSIDPNTLVHVAGSLASVLAIISYEHGHVVVSRALNMVHRKKDL